MARVLWQDLYAIQVDRTGRALATHLAASEPSFDAADVGIQGTGSANGKFLMPLNDHPNFKSPSGVIDTAQARGISTRHEGEYDTVQTGEPVEFTLPLNAHAYNIATFLPLLFQTGATEAAHAASAFSLNRLSCVPYTQADSQYFAYITRHVQMASESDDIDLLVKGAIASAITYSGESGGVLTQEVTIQGASWSQTALNAYVNTLETAGFDKVNALKYQDSQIAFEDVFTYSYAYSVANGIEFDATGKTITNSGGDAFTTGDCALAVGGGDYIYVKGSALNDGRYLTDAVTTTEITLDSGETLVDETASGIVTIAKVNWVTVNAPSMSVTVNNNPAWNYYNDDAASSVYMGMLTAEGSISLPFGQDTVGENYMISRFLNGEPLRIAWYWGQSGSAVSHENDYDLNDATGPDRFKNDSSATDPRNYFSIIMNAMVTDYEMAGDNELMVDCTLAAVKDSVNNAIEVYACYFDELLDRIA